ncbi:Uncharacterised protein [Streptococcus pneumoniae]|nr:Uncharacterised protein [Streptococcus pneumoniae]
MSESCATDGCPGNALPRSLTLLAALIANPTSFARFSIYVNSTSEIVPSSLDEMCVKGAKTNLFFNSTPFGNVTLSNNELYLLFITLPPD